MTKKNFQAESKRLMDMMVHSIYTNDEIFLRELISNASDAMDKMYYIALQDEDMTFRREDYYVRITPDSDNRTLTIEDRGVGMTEEELDNNLGIIAQSDSHDFKNTLEMEEDYGLIGQFGVGFYSSFMVAKKVEVLTKSYKEDRAYRWTSEGADGYTVEDGEKGETGTVIILHLKENTEEEDYDRFLNPGNLSRLVKKYSNYIRYPIKMSMEKKRPVEDTDPQDPQFETYREDEVLNSMVPLWRKNKRELSPEDYTNFYHERHFGFDEPLHTIHMNMEGSLAFKAILFIPSTLPFNLYQRDYQSGLELYSNGVMIMEQCGELLPDYLSFIKGVVDSEDISLNISREMLQQDRQLALIKRRIEKRILDELKKLMSKDREKYETFFQVFGVHLKAGTYDHFGQNADKLKDLLLFSTTKEGKLRSIEEYRKDMLPDQAYIYYANGDSVENIRELPQIKPILDREYEVLCFTDNVDEFAIKVLRQYDDKEFRSISAFHHDEQESEENKKENKLLDKMKEILGDGVVDIRENNSLKGDASFLSSRGEISIDMEKTLSHLPGTEHMVAEKVLELNPNHSSFKKLEEYYVEDPERFKLYTHLLYNQARIIAGLDIEDPLQFVRNISELM